MEIEFNPNRVVKPNPSAPAIKPEATRRSAEELPLRTVVTLDERLRNLPSVRPEKVQRAKLLIGQVKYPPEEMLDRIANLLAMRIY